ncbi:WRKY transcription factor 44-like [Pyrus ussuriensis x Pyrus communis]|uniref:WRKY transcription factor 44-like n=1 Tax=Pyrus ussuriensis x Pyrus communis TaxID=2448454 RepID=A0A5N5H7W7_9ROSA|nr:WRKY transcription factor 44-like [Pyrus ussuriensis x Pyrus communis]
MAMTLTQKSVVFPRAAQATTAAVVCFLLLIPLLIIIREELASWTLTKQEPSRIALEETQEQGQRNQGPQELELDREIKPKGTSFFSNIFKKPPRGEDYTILQAILSIDILLIFIAKLFGLGSSFTATDNLGQIDEALGYKPQTINAFVSLISIWNFLCSLNERREGSEGRVEDQSEVGLPVQSCQTKAPLPYDPHLTGGITASGATPDNSCGLSGECEEASKGLEAENYEPRSKRRKSENHSIEAGISGEGVQDPRVVVQNSVESDMTGDGFRWRKNYYRCTSLECSVRKHVDRVSDDPKAFITTYEGKHNHDMPLRNTNAGRKKQTPKVTAAVILIPALDALLCYAMPIVSLGNLFDGLETKNGVNILT